ncbi:HPr family phosphocarrier protein [Peribacillus butanolivorans]|uniref:HPr family phosphocarrier protein n=1 Tax=Peribacillus butanolivorans TaxID=421767 RepID=UPI00365C941D
MNKVISTDIKTNKRFSMRQIMNLYQVTKEFKGNIYFICKHKMVDAKKLSTFVSFVLILQERATMKVILEGENVQAMLENVQTICKKNDSSTFGFQ